MLNKSAAGVEQAAGARNFFVLIASIGALAILSSTLSKTPVLPLFAAHLGATPQEIGWIVIASTIPGILISFPAGAISDFFGKRRMIITSLVVFATAPFLYLLVTESWQLMAVRFYHGFATAIFNTVATAALAAQYPQRRAAVLSTYSSVTIVGRSIAPFLGGFLISVANFHSVYWACAVSGVIALAVGLMLPPERTRVQTTVHFPHFFAALRDVLSSRAIMLTSIVEAAQFLVFGAVEAFLALYAARVGIPPWQIGIILGVQLLSVIVVKPVMGNLSDRLGRRAIIFPGLALGVISVALVPVTDNVFALSTLSVLYGAAFATVTSSTTALVVDATKNGQFGASVGVLRTIMDVGQTIGPVLAGFLIAAWGYGVAFPVLAMVIAASAVLFALVPKP
ncbi:MAG: major facilitator superfamily protein [Betaproteobacteria bacterium]|nr:major facilitator superfamily protein [Betaproteobacteria bacterium]